MIFYFELIIHFNFGVIITYNIVMFCNFFFKWHILFSKFGACGLSYSSPPCPSGVPENLNNIYEKNLFGYIGRTSKTEKSCRAKMQHEIQRFAPAFHMGVDQYVRC